MPALNGLGNVLLSNDIIAKEALRLLKNNLVFGRIASKRYQEEYSDVGNTINIQLPARVKSTSGRVIGIKPMVKRTVALTIDQQQNVGLEFTAQDRTLSIGQFSDQFLKSAVAQIANAIDVSIATVAYQQAFFQYGTAGSAINEDTILDAMAQAELTGHPQDGLTSVVMDPRDRSAIAKSLKTKYNPEMVSQAIRKGFIGELDNVATYSSANVRTHLVGAYAGTPLTNGVPAAGATTLVTDGWSNSIALGKKGDVFTVAGVYSVNPQNYDSTGILQQFVLTADVSSNGSGQATLSFSPAMNDGTQTTVDAAGNSTLLDAYQNISALPADNAAIVWAGTTATRYRIAPMFHRDALAFACPPLRKMPEFPISESMTDPDTGLSISMLGGGDITNHTAIYRLDAIWGVKAVYPELITRLIGATA
jgi:hypothetical protein